MSNGLQIPKCNLQVPCFVWSTVPNPKVLHLQLYTKIQDLIQKFLELLWKLSLYCKFFRSTFQILFKVVSLTCDTLIPALLSFLETFCFISLCNTRVQGLLQFSWISSMVVNLLHFVSGNKKKSRGARSVEYRGCKTTTALFLIKKACSSIVTVSAAVLLSKKTKFHTNSAL